MKKIMIAAAAAAMIVSAQAIVCAKGPCGEEGAGIAHKVAISLKTTANKGKTMKVECSEPECMYWRQQATKKVNGLIWEQLDDCTGCVPFGANCAFWTADQALDVEFAMGVGLIGKSFTSKSIEAYGTLAGDEFGELAWAGFGSMAGSTKKVQCADAECVQYVKSISGGIAGQLIPADWEGLCGDTCDPIVYTGCCDDMQLSNTAAYGTIKISYDKATSKKVATAADASNIASFYKLPAAVASDIVVSEVVVEE